MEESKAEKTYTFFMDPQPSPDFLPSLGLAAHYMGDYSGIKTIEYRDLVTNEPGYLSLPSLRREVVTDNYNHPINYRYVETESIFGRTIMESTIKGDSIYYVKRFLDDNPYQPAEAVVLIWDAERNQYWGVKSIVYNETLDIDSLQKELGLTDAQKRDVVSCALHILKEKDNYTESQIESNLQELLAGGKLRFVKADTRIGNQPVYQEFYLEGDSLGRAIVINRANTTFITEQFIAGSRAPKSGYFLDENGTAFLQITNTDDADPEYGLGKDEELNYYRVRYRNLISGEVWYRWHYEYHVWGGWAYEERGYFEPAGTDAFGRQINNWVPVVHTDVQDWLYDSDSPKSTSSWFVLPGQEKVLIYRSLDKGRADPDKVSEMVSEAAMRNINSAELGEQEYKDLTKLRDTSNPALLREVQYNYSYGKQEDRYYYEGHPLKDAAIVDPQAGLTYGVNLNWQIDSKGPYYNNTWMVNKDGKGVAGIYDYEQQSASSPERKNVPFDTAIPAEVKKAYLEQTGVSLVNAAGAYSDSFGVDLKNTSLIETRYRKLSLVGQSNGTWVYSDSPETVTYGYSVPRDPFGNKIFESTYTTDDYRLSAVVNKWWDNNSAPFGQVPGTSLIDRKGLSGWTELSGQGTGLEGERLWIYEGSYNEQENEVILVSYRDDGTVAYKVYKGKKFLKDPNVGANYDRYELPINSSYVSDKIGRNLVTPEPDKKFS
jgi:hypothetical protein